MWSRRPARFRPSGRCPPGPVLWTAVCLWVAVAADPVGGQEPPRARATGLRLAADAPNRTTAGGPPPPSTAALARWESVSARQNSGPTGPLRIPARWMIRFFQRFVSPVDGASCTFVPSCSTYGAEAVRRHGFLVGAAMAAERTLRDHHPDAPDRYPLLETQDGVYYVDPVEANDFWWAGSR